jgi:solute carrier family 35 protein E3
VYFGMTVSIVSTVSLVLVNKWIFDRDGFQFMATLSSLHFGFTALATRLLLGADFFEYKAPDGGTSKVLPVAMGSMCSVLFMNMNLAYNSVWDR